jgi:hypothetical protein
MDTSTRLYIRFPSANPDLMKLQPVPISHELYMRFRAVCEATGIGEQDAMAGALYAWVHFREKELSKSFSAIGIGGEGEAYICLP